MTLKTHETLPVGTVDRIDASGVRLLANRRWPGDEKGEQRVAWVVAEVKRRGLRHFCDGRLLL